jgi:hypothetical protein
MKESRIIAALEPVMGAHRLVLSKKAARDENNQRQLTRLYETRGALKHDDRVDVLAAAVSHFEDTLGIDIDHQIALNDEKEFKELVATWEDDERRAPMLLGNRATGAQRVKTLTPKEVSKTIFGQSRNAKPSNWSRPSSW